MRPDLVILKITHALDPRAFQDRLVNTTRLGIVIGWNVLGRGANFSISMVSYLSNIIAVDVLGLWDAIPLFDWDPVTRRVTYREYNQLDDIPASLPPPRTPRAKSPQKPRASI